jgi:hypothetical protein
MQLSCQTKGLFSPGIDKEGVGVTGVPLASPGLQPYKKDWDIASNGSL